MPFYTGHVAAASNRADLLFQVQLVDPVTNDSVDFTGATITVALRPVKGGGNNYSSPTLTGTNHDGHITVIGPGNFEVKFSRAEMTQFSPGDLDIGVGTAQRGFDQAIEQAGGIRDNVGLAGFEADPGLA